MQFKTAYNILEVTPSASRKEIKEAYLALVEVWHPDRFANKPELRHKATEKLKDLNLAYETLCPRCPSPRIEKPPVYPEQPKASESANSHVLIRCVSCLSMNRVVCFGPGLVCGSCGAILSLKGKHSAYRPDGRIPCGNDACLGVIGPKGLCTICGLSLAKSSRRSGLPFRGRSRLAPLALGAVLCLALLLVFGWFNTTTTLKNANALVASVPPKPSLLEAAESAVSEPPLPSALISPASLKEIERLLKNEFAGSPGMKKEKVKAYQWNLRTLGYYSGRIDGKLGPNTYAGLRDFMLDFKLPRFKLSADAVLRTLIVQVSVQDVYHEWTSMNRSGSLDYWLKRLEPADRIKATEIIVSDRVKDILALIKGLKRDNRLAWNPGYRDNTRN